MASGWTSDDGVSNQIADSITDEIMRVRSLLPFGESLFNCEECGATIPELRRKALPGVKLCIHCQEEADKESVAYTGYNRRGSKDSQLR